MSDKPASLRHYAAGLVPVLIIAYLARVADPFIKEHWKFGADALHLNYVLIAIILGMFVKNTVGVPEALKPGIGLTRPALKVGIVIMGSLYSLRELTRLGVDSVIIITAFVIGTALLVLWLADRMRVDRSIAGLMACGAGVCGVSAIIAVVPIVRAKGEEIAYAIGTILIFGVVCLFIFPAIGSALSLSDTQFGAWAGTGILNSGQVLGATFAYSLEAGKVGGIFNIVRVMWLPVVVVLVALWYVKKEAVDEHVPVKKILITKFPIFVLGFLLIVVLRTTGVIAADDLFALQKLMFWFFAIGFAGIGLSTSFKDMRRAGGKPFVLGSVAAVVKAVGALIVVKIFL